MENGVALVAPETGGEVLGHQAKPEREIAAVRWCMKNKSENGNYLTYDILYYFLGL
jgi:hypothetical protein